MELIFCNKSDNREYICFSKSIYNTFPNYKDSWSPVVKEFLQKKGAFCKNLSIDPIMVKQNGSIVATCMYIHSINDPKVLQIAFFEALEGYQKAVDLIVETAKGIAFKKSLNKIIIGLNGHVNYGIGFLCDKFNRDISFGSNFTPPYYVDYFLKHNPVQHKMVSYNGNTNYLNFDSEKKILERINKRFNYRKLDFKNFKEDMKIYTYLNNICFKNHPFYFQRTNREDYELFKGLRHFISQENILFVQSGETPIGYMLWYPDFNELMKNGETIGIKAFIKNKLFSKRIKKFKIVEIAILPEFQKSGAIMGLFNEWYKRALHRYSSYESSWIFESNFKSKNFGVKWAENEYKHYVAFEIPLLEESLC